MCDVVFLKSKSPKVVGNKQTNLREENEREKCPKEGDTRTS